MTTRRMYDVPSDPASDRRQDGSGPIGVKWATGRADVGNQAAHAKCVTGRSQWPQLRNKLSIGTWNVRGLLQTGKLHIVERELKRERIPICGISETHWKDNGHFNTNDHVVYMSGADRTGSNGVAIVVEKSLTKFVEGYETISDRLIKITLTCKPVKLHIIQVYMPTSTSSDDEVDLVYTQLEEAINRTPKRDVLMIMGDFNAKVGNTEKDEHIRNVLGKHGLGERNERGERLIQFAIDNSLVVTNTVFKHHPRRLSTWTSPTGEYKNQIDFVLIRARWRSSITNVRTRPGAYCNSDHKLLRSELKIKLRATIKQSTNRRMEIPDNNIFQEILQNIGTPSPKETPEEMWQDTRTWIIEGAKQCSDYRQVEKRNHWMTDNTLKLIDLRKKLRNSPTRTEESKKLDKEIKKACRRDKNQHISKICQEIEHHADKGGTHELYKKVKYLAREFKPQTQLIRNDQNEIVTDKPGIAEVWRKYCINLYKENNREEPNDLNTSMSEKEPHILRSEVEKALNTLKNNKAQGIDSITSELLKAMGELGVQVFHKICNLIWESGKWPNDWTESVFITLFKKGSPTECNNYRTISLISHASKVMLQIINNRLKSFILPEISEEQTGFIPGKGTRENILNVRQIIEKTYEFNIKAYLCFVDYTKAFDCVKWHKLWPILKSMGVPLHLIQLIRSLYENSNARVKIDQTLSDSFKIEAGVRQGCILSPLLFNAYSEYIMRRVLEDWDGGISVGGRKVNNLRYADDTLIIASSDIELEYIMNKLNTVSEEYGLLLNRNKTKIMVIDRTPMNIKEIAGFEVVEEFVYLGSLITNKGGCDKEIKRRLNIARNAVTRLTKIWKDSAISQNNKLKLINALIFPIATYASETWTINVVARRKIDAFETWVYRRMLRIPWTQHRTNVSILNQLKIKNRLSTKINQSYLRYFGHISRRNDLEKLMVEGKINGKRPRGRSPNRWADQVKPLIGHSMHEAIHAAQDRDSWRGTILAIET